MQPRTTLSGLVAVVGLLVAGQILAQGQDSTPGERNLLIMAELLPGSYDNANQHYFERRRLLSDADRHVRMHTTLTRVHAPAFGEYAYLWINRSTAGDEQVSSYRIATLSASGEEVVMRHYLRMAGAIDEADLASLTPADLRRTEGCDYFFRRRADHFRGAQRDRNCRFDWEGQPVYTNNEIELSATSLFFFDHKFVAATGERITGVGSAEPFWMERARLFHCYVDMPGVGGGRVSLQAVTWHVLNERGGAFNRDSLVLYAMERLADGSIVEHGYAFTDTAATRIGNNLKWMLVNCAMTPRDQARAEL